MTYGTQSKITKNDFWVCPKNINGERLHMKHVKRILIIVLILFVILFGLFGIYFSNYYHAEEESKKYLVSTENVNVTENDSYYFFDGPGNTHALIFYQGAKVEAEAYAKLLYKISEKGIDTFLIKMPFNFAFFGSQKASDVLKSYSYDNYYIAGHSLRRSSIGAVL